jgi:Family of unknown function (DUF5681)
MSNAEFTVEKQRPAHLFRPGQSGNPSGRPKGARSRLAENFIADLANAWKEHGSAALLACAKDYPDKFVKVIADLMPREAMLGVDIDISVSQVNDALSAYRLLKSLPPAELRQLHADHADDAE